MSRFQWFALAWMTSLAISIVAGLWIAGTGSPVPLELGYSVVFQALAGSWIIQRAVEEEEK